MGQTENQRFFRHWRRRDMHTRLELMLTPDWGTGQNRNRTKKVAFDAPVFEGAMRAWKCVFHVDGQPPRHAYGETAMYSLMLATRLISTLEEKLD